MESSEKFILDRLNNFRRDRDFICYVCESKEVVLRELTTFDGEIYSGNYYCRSCSEKTDFISKKIALKLFDNCSSCGESGIYGRVCDEEKGTWSFLCKDCLFSEWDNYGMGFNIKPAKR